MKKRIVTVLSGLLLFYLVYSHPKKPLMPEDLYKIKRVSDPRISPDGQWIAFTVTRYDLGNNNSNSDIWLVPINGGAPRQLTASPESDHSPRWSPDGQWLAFISSRDEIGNIYLIRPDGGEARKLSDSTTVLSDPVWTGNGKYILCRSRVLPEGKKGEKLENWTREELPKCEARSIDRLLFRQSDRWLGDERNHLLLVNRADGSMKDLTPADADVPPVSLTSGHDFDVSPDGREICFVRNDDPMLAVSTNQDLFIMDIETLKESRVTTNPALDHGPRYSPDGRYIAYQAMEKVGYEADRKRLMIFNRMTGKHACLTGSLDRSVAQILWSPDSRFVYFTCRELGRSSIYRVDLKGSIKTVTREGYNISPDISPKQDRLVFLRSTNHRPYEIYSLPMRGKKKVSQLTSVNAEFLEEFELPELEEFWFSGAEGTKVHGFLQKPPGFDPGKKYPVVLTIHGGPQNMWADRFMTTWFTFQLVCSPGYVGVFINPRGSGGYGSEFREQVSKDYGGRCFTDLMKGLDYVIEHYDFIDKNRQAAIGGSFGGYTVNWILGHTRRFKCLVSHAGLYNMDSFYGATEELWFPAWDAGETPWDEPELYKKWSPHHHAKEFKTPTLVIHGEKDYRVPFAESLQLFTALRRQGIASRLVVFPDEGHVISGPQNNVRWWKEMHRWLKMYLKN